MTIGSAYFLSFDSDSYFVLMVCVYVAATCFCFACYYCSAATLCLLTLSVTADHWSHRGACGVDYENPEMHSGFRLGGDSCSCFFFCICCST